MTTPTPTTTLSSSKSILTNVAIASLVAGVAYAAVAIVPGQLLSPQVFANGRYVVISYPGGAFGHIHKILFSDDGKRFTFQTDLGHDHGSDTELLLEDYAFLADASPTIHESVHQVGHSHRFSVVGPF